MTEREIPKIDLFLLASLWVRNAGRLLALGIALALLGAAVLAASVGKPEPVYEATVSLVPTASQASETMVRKSLPNLLGSDLLRRKVCGYLEVEQIPQVSVTVLENAPVYTLTVRHGDPEWSWRILEAMVECAPELACAALGEIRLTILSDSGIPAVAVESRGLEWYLALGAAAGAAVWMVLVLAVTLLRRTLWTGEELPLPCLGCVPAETERLALRLERSMGERQVLLVAGAIGGDGATDLTVALAGALSRRGRRVLIVDCDRFAPTALEHLDGQDGVRVASFRMDPRSPEQKERLAELLNQARRDKDIILLDVPPCALTADGGELSELADCGLLVLRRDHAGRHQLREAIGLLTQNGMELLGWICNR